MTSIISDVFGLIDEKRAAIEEKGLRASVIVINEALFKRLQLEMVQQDMHQVYGKMRSPHSIQVYNGLRVVPSQVVELVDVL